jgi:glycosyltransferase involved in cell wall biosynthesis
MRICIFTNTFLPHVGGVARSVRTFLEDFRRAGHRVLVIAPEYADGPAPQRIERSVERVPAWQKFNGSEFSVSLPLGPELVKRVARFRPDIIHAQHPFLLGDSALRLAAQHGVPVVFTHHTLYEQYTHYVPLDSTALQAFVIELATRFANCCQGVIAPSDSLARLLVERGVTAPMKIVPTGIDTTRFARASRTAWRRRLDLTADAVLLGHVGRLAVEKNLPFLAEAMARVLAREPKVRALVVGDGPARAEFEAVFARHGVAERVHLAGQLTGRRLREAYAAMDLFVFSSRSETQGMVLTEAMAAGCPVIALDASGARDVVRDDVNGRLLPAEAKAETMTRAVLAAVRDPAGRARWRREARRTARTFDRRTTAAQALKFYRSVITAFPCRERADLDDWEAWWTQFRDRIAIEGRLISDKVAAAAHAIVGGASAAEAAPEPTGRRSA